MPIYTISVISKAIRSRNNGPDSLVLLVQHQVLDLPPQVTKNHTLLCGTEDGSRRLHFKLATEVGPEVLQRPVTILRG
jgi:hypothetical protein